jgi:hypothetical protein
MTNEERTKLEIEKSSYQEVIKQFTKGCDSRMEVELDAFLCEIEDKIIEINKKLEE